MEREPTVCQKCQVQSLAIPAEDSQVASAGKDFSLRPWKAREHTVLVLMGRWSDCIFVCSGLLRSASQEPKAPCKTALKLTTGI